MASTWAWADGGIVEDGVARRRNRMAFHEGLGESLAALELGGVGRGTEGRDADLAQAIGESRRQRILGADDDEVDHLATREGDDPRQIVRLRLGMADGETFHRCTARGGMQAPELVTLGELPHQRMLAPAAADDEDLQAFVPLFSGGQ